ncbi:Ctr copper transporter [Xylariales sp. PMI_506]|nr:Ctr copper transporter [Xylariales sp. PMI_506]
MSTSSSDSTTMMMSVFQNEIDTPLYSAAWAPANAGQYAATCIFLIVLGALFRGLLAAKAVQEARWMDRELNRRFVAVAGKQSLSEQVSRDDLSKRMTLTENGVEENVVVVQRTHGTTRPWRLSVDPIRALIDTVVAGVGYLLMLAVMTMNVGYFISVLGGVFVGSLLVGRYVTGLEH